MVVRQLCVPMAIGGHRHNGRVRRRITMCGESRLITDLTDLHSHSQLEGVGGFGSPYLNNPPSRVGLRQLPRELLHRHQQQSHPR